MSIVTTNTHFFFFQAEDGIRAADVTRVQTCALPISADTGELLYDERLGTLGYYYSSPVAADHRIYVASAEGVVTVIDAGVKLNVLATNKLDGAILATPAL